MNNIQSNLNFKKYFFFNNLTLLFMILQGSMHLKQYLPPLHMTLMKLLVDSTSRALRVRTGQVFARIAPIHHRLEQLQTDLVGTLKPGTPSHEDAGVRETSVCALRVVLAAAGTLFSAASRKSLLVLLLGSLSAPTSGLGSPPFTVTADDATRIQLAAALGALAATFPRDTPADQPELSALLGFILTGKFEYLAYSFVPLLNQYRL